MCMPNVFFKQDPSQNPGLPANNASCCSVVLYFHRRSATFAIITSLEQKQLLISMGLLRLESQ